MQDRTDISRLNSRWLALAEVTVFVVIALVSRRVLDPFIWKFAGPISLVGTLILLTVYMRFRGLKWSQMGLRKLPGLRSKLLLIPQMLLVFVLFASAVALITIGGPAVGLEFLGERPAGADDRWGAIEGNLPLYLIWVGIVWVSAAFGEEMFFRGFLITRLKVGFAEIPFATVLAVFLPALIFGYGHMYYQGLRGLVMTGVIALIFGSLFLAFRRNLWPIILFHGIFDTLVMTAIYLNWDA
ncbi:MAG: type II CAAX endopeptidase family protein [Pseudomonadota bacterium]